MYTGLAITSKPSGNFLYAADNTNNVIDMYDGNFTLVKSFGDPNIPSDFSVFGVQDINGLVYVAYAVPNVGAGGFIDLFTENGTFLKTLVQGLQLNQAWGMAAAPPWSRDGRRVAVTQFQANESNSIWLTAVDGSGAEEVVPVKPILRGGPFSPDGRSLLYTYRKDGSFQVFSIDVTNRQERQLTFSAADKYDPIWSPDGKWAVYSSNRGGPCCQIWKSSAGGGEEQQLTNGFDRILHLSFSPDGYWLYFQPNHLNVYRMPFSGGPKQQVTKFSEAGLFLEEPTLSPDGKWLAYGRNNGGSSLWLLELGSDHETIR